MQACEATSPLAGDVLHAFVATARRVFHDERWDAVAPYVQRAWEACEVSEYTAWEDVEALLREAWSR